MRDLTSIIADLMAEGANARIIALAVEAHALALAQANPSRTARQERNARYYDRKKAGLTGPIKTVSDAFKTVKTSSDATKTLSDGPQGTAPCPSPDGLPSPPAPPHPSLNPSPSPESLIDGQASANDPQSEPAETVEVAAEPKTEKPAKPRKNDWPEDFQAQFWELYPRKVAKKPAIKRLVAIMKSDAVSFFDIMTGLKRYIQLGLEDEFIAHPATWLNEERWNDEEQQRYSTKRNSTISSKPTTLAGESKRWWLDQARKGDDNLKGHANGRRHDDGEASFEHDAGPAGGDVSPEPRPGLGQADGRRSPAAERVDRYDDPSSRESARIPGWN